MSKQRSRLDQFDAGQCRKSTRDFDIELRLGRVNALQGGLWGLTCSTTGANANSQIKVQFLGTGPTQRDRLQSRNPNGGCACCAPSGSPVEVGVGQHQTLDSFLGMVQLAQGDAE